MTFADRALESFAKERNRMKITDLTPEQTAKFPEYAARWTAIGFSCEPANVKEARRCIEAVYLAGKSTPPRLYAVADSPLSAGVLSTLIRTDAFSPGEPSTPSTPAVAAETRRTLASLLHAAATLDVLSGSSTPPTTESIRATADEALRDAEREVKNAVREAVAREVRSPLSASRGLLRDARGLLRDARGSIPRVTDAAVHYNLGPLMSDTDLLVGTYVREAACHAAPGVVAYKAANAADSNAPKIVHYLRSALEARDLNPPALRELSWLQSGMVDASWTDANRVVQAVEHLAYPTMRALHEAVPDALLTDALASLNTVLDVSSGTDVASQAAAAVLSPAHAAATTRRSAYPAVRDGVGLFVVDAILTALEPSRIEPVWAGVWYTASDPDAIRFGDATADAKTAVGAVRSAVGPITGRFVTVPVSDSVYTGVSDKVSFVSDVADAADALSIAGKASRRSSACVVSDARAWVARGSLSLYPGWLYDYLGGPIWQATQNGLGGTITGEVAASAYGATEPLYLAEDARDRANEALNRERVRVSAAAALYTVGAVSVLETVRSGSLDAGESQSLVPPVRPAGGEAAMPPGVAAILGEGSPLPTWVSEAVDEALKDARTAENRDSLVAAMMDAVAAAVVPLPSTIRDAWEPAAIDTGYDLIATDLPLFNTAYEVRYASGAVEDLRAASGARSEPAIRSDSHGSRDVFITTFFAAYAASDLPTDGRTPPAPVAVAHIASKARNATMTPFNQSAWIQVLRTLTASVDVRDVLNGVAEASEGKPPANLSRSLARSVWRSVRALASEVAPQAGSAAPAATTLPAADRLQIMLASVALDAAGEDAVLSAMQDVGGFLREGIRESIQASAYGSHDAHWLAFYAFVRDELGLKDPIRPLDPLIELAEHCGWWTVAEDVCIIQHRHAEVHRDEQGRLHNANGMAVRYRDGFGVWALNGTQLPQDSGEKIVMRPETQTVEEIDAERDNDIRAIRLARFGMGRYLVESGAMVIDEGRNDVEGTHEALLETPNGRKFLWPTCPSGRVCPPLPVPDTITTREQARNWLAGDKPFRTVART